MTVKKLEQDFAVCKIKELAQIDFTDEFYFVGKTDQEISLVCAAGRVPRDALACEPGWKAFRIEGVLDFSLIGILAKLSAILAEHEIGIFVVSTYNTDYIFVKREQFARAAAALQDGGYRVEA